MLENTKAELLKIKEMDFYALIWTVSSPITLKNQIALNYRVYHTFIYKS